MGWLSRTFYGVDLDEEQLRQDRLDAELAALNERKRAERPDIYSDDWYEEAENNRRASFISDVDGEVRDAFNTEVTERAANFRDFAGDAVNAVVVSPFKLIPWQVWLAAAVFAAWKFGLFKGILKR